MNPVARFFAFVAGLAGFFVMPVSFWLFFAQLRLEHAGFYTGLVAASGILERGVEERLEEDGLSRKAYGPDLAKARRVSRKALGRHLRPQVEVGLNRLGAWLAEGGRFPELRFDLAALRKELVESAAAVAENRLVGRRLEERYAALPSALDVAPWLRGRWEEVVASVRPYMPTLVLLRRFTPAVALVFLFAYLFTMFDFRPAFHAFASLLAASAVVFLVVFLLVLAASAGPWAEAWLPYVAKYLPSLARPVDEAVRLRGWAYLLREGALQGIWASLAMVAVAALFYMAPRRRRR